MKEEEGYQNIRVKLETKDKLDSIKVHPRETYNEVLVRLVDIQQKRYGFSGIGDKEMKL